MSDNEVRRPASEFAVNVFSGTGLGLLVGVIVGLSLTPVVSVIIGALGSVLAVFLGLQGGGDSSSQILTNIRFNGVRIGSFGFATVIGLLLALYIRSAEPFAPPVEDLVARWKTVGFEPAAVSDIVLYEKLGILPGGRSINADVAAQQQKQKSHALFAELDQIDLCYELDPGRLDNRPERVLESYRRQHNATLNSIADDIETMSDEVQISVLKTVHTLICKLQPNGAGA